MVCPWAEASERHQFLYTDRPTRLQLLTPEWIQRRVTLHKLTDTRMLTTEEFRSANVISYGQFILPPAQLRARYSRER